ncbi:ANTAR domain-containing protein [Kribbella sp. CA-293567]|uniref:ANTAR domain-containing protein n=1 Tax=Kribbella sp. CA-293567 TaxID=3002436 RepID=UPI0022DE3FE1|nr:ANTAR domain-containing protein [Kribbella sp. CA-293567]WBQ03489.1 ANTAR domain-containing protein [Kribbella sp. CA-293567]
MDEVDKTTLLVRMARLIADKATDVPLETRLCLAYLGILGGDGAALTLSYTLPDRITLCTTDDVAARLEDLQDVLGEGPGPTAYRTGQIVVADLRSEQNSWPMFADAARQIPGASVLYAVPMRPREDGVIGVLTVHQGDADLPDLDQAQFLVNAIAAAVIKDPPDESELLIGPWAARSQIHQATGMVVAQLRVGPDDAMALLRAHAFTHNLTLSEVAERITSRRLHFSDDAESETS